MNWYLKVLKNYAVFQGRAQRAEYWFFVLFNSIAGIIMMTLDNVAGLAPAEGGIGPLYGLYSLAMLIPSLAVAARRLHDTGRSGWMMLLALIPCVGAILLLVWAVQDSSPGANQYGPNPKGA